MAKRYGAFGRNVTKKRSHPRKTKKRQEAKRRMLADRAMRKAR